MFPALQRLAIKQADKTGFTLRQTTGGEQKHRAQRGQEWIDAFHL
jgi:hypothetical protein